MSRVSMIRTYVVSALNLWWKFNGIKYNWVIFPLHGTLNDNLKRIMMWNPVSSGTRCIITTEHHAVACKNDTGDMMMSCVNAHHHLVLGDPAVSGEVLQHRHQKLKTSVPMTQQQHHSNQIDDSHHCTGQIIGHVKNLKGNAQENHSLTLLPLIQWPPFTFLIIP